MSKGTFVTARRLPYAWWLAAMFGLIGAVAGEFMPANEATKNWWAYGLQSVSWLSLGLIPFIQGGWLFAWMKFGTRFPDTFFTAATKTRYPIGTAARYLLLATTCGLLSLFEALRLAAVIGTLNQSLVYSLTGGAALILALLFFGEELLDRLRRWWWIRTL